MLLSEDFLEFYFALLIRQYTWQGWGVLPTHEPTLTPGAQRRLRGAAFEEGPHFAAVMLDQMMRGSLDGVYCKRCGLTAGELIAIKLGWPEHLLLCLARPRIVAQREEDDG